MSDDLELTADDLDLIVTDIRLMGAARDLLTACQAAYDELLAWDTDQDENDPAYAVMQQLKQAITQATGMEPR